MKKLLLISLLFAIVPHLHAQDGAYTSPKNSSGGGTPAGSTPDVQYNNGGSLGAVTSPTTPNSVPEMLCSTPSGGTAQTPAWCLSGVPTDAQTGTTYTVAATDRNGYLSFSNAGAIAVTLPQAGSTNFASNFAFRACDIGAGTATITPTTSTISYTTGSAYTAGASSLALTTGQCASIFSDNSNYFANVYQASSGANPGGAAGNLQYQVNGTTFGGLSRTVVLNSGANQIPTTPAANTVYILADTSANYTQSAAITVSNAGVTILCLQPTTVIKFTGATDGFDVTGANFTLSGCTIDHNSQSAAGTGPLITLGTSVTAANDALIQNNTFQNTGTTNSQTGTVLIQNGLRARFIWNTFTGTQADRCVYVHPLNAKATTDENISWNYVTAFNSAVNNVGCIHADDGNGGGASISNMRVEHNTINGQNSSGTLLIIQGTSISPTAASPRNMSVSFNNFFYTGSLQYGVKLFTFLNSRFEGNVIDDKTFASQDLLSLGDTYNSTFAGNTLRAQGNTSPAWLSADEQGNSTTNNQIFGEHSSGVAAFEWQSSSGVLSQNNVTGNTVQLGTAVAGVCYEYQAGTASFAMDGNVFSSNNCIGDSTANQEGLDIRVTTASGATTIQSTNILGNTFIKVPTGIKITDTAQNNTGPAVISGVLINDNTFETVTTGISVTPAASSGAGAINISGLSINNNYYKSVTTAYLATPNTGNTIVGTDIGDQLYDTVTTAINDTGSGTTVGISVTTLFVTADFVTAANTNLQAITGLAFTFPANVAKVAEVACDLQYNQQTAAAADAFGFQDVTVGPTQINATGFVQTAATTWVDSVLTASAPTTTATNIVAFTPSAITTVWHAQLHMTIEQPSNASSSVFQVMVKTGTSADTVTVKRGSACTVHFTY